MVITKIRAHVISWWQSFRRRIMLLTPRMRLCLLAGFLVLSFTGAVIPRSFTISLSNSVGYVLFYRKPQVKPSSLKKGTFVLFDIYTNLRPNCRPCRVVKEISCQEGDVLTMDDGDFYCNNAYIGHAKASARDGTPLTAFRFNGLIPEGKLFVTGACIDSYDSRYIGFIEKTDIQEVVVPIL